MLSTCFLTLLTQFLCSPRVEVSLGTQKLLKKQHYTSTKEETHSCLNRWREINPLRWIDGWKAGLGTTHPMGAIALWQARFAAYKQHLLGSAQAKPPWVMSRLLEGWNLHMYLEREKNPFFASTSLQGKKVKTGGFMWDITEIKESAKKELLRDVLQQNRSGLMDRLSGEGSGFLVCTLREGPPKLPWGLCWCF